MAYFSNGTEGEGYQNHYCCRCANYRDLEDGRGPGCALWDLFLLHNSDQFPEHAKTDEERGAAEATKAILDHLIPESDDGCSAGECSMFLLDTERDVDTLEMFPR